MMMVVIMPTSVVTMPTILGQFPYNVTDRQPYSSLTLLTRVTFDRSERYGVGTVVLAEPWVETKQLDPVCLLGSADVIGMGHYPLPARFFMLALSCMSDVEP